MINFSDLADEVKLQIFNHLTAQEQSKYAVVSKEWERLLNDNKLWKNNLKNLGFFAESPNKRTYLTYISAIKQLYGLLTSPNGNVRTDDYLIGRDVLKAQLEAYLDKVSFQFNQLLPGFLTLYPNINDIYILSLTLLHLSMILGDVKAVTYLLSYETPANPNQVDGRGDTPLIIVTYLFDEYKDSNIGKTIMALLLQYGADPTIANTEGETAMEYGYQIFADNAIQALQEAINLRQTTIARP